MAPITRQQAKKMAAAADTSVKNDLSASGETNMATSTTAAASKSNNSQKVTPTTSIGPAKMGQLAAYLDDYPLGADLAVRKVWLAEIAEELGISKFQVTKNLSELRRKKAKRAA